MEKFGNPLENKKVGLEEAKSFEELYEMLEILGEVEGTLKIYTPDVLKTKIEQVRHGHRDLSFITRSHGLREVVERLLKDDLVFAKYVSKK